MAAETGKTLVSSAIIKMFLRLYNVKEVLFLVDRLELETQAHKVFDEVLRNDFKNSYLERKPIQIGQRRKLLSQPFSHLQS
ncbi:MAG: DEAD/DEAH box helicase family protein [Candidatus Eutrophobiaceae bacterium]